MLTKLQKLREEREEGFTLIELLVVILIIGILSAIAIPAFMNQRKSAVDSSVQADITSVAKEIATQEVKAGGAKLAITVTTATAGDVAKVALGVAATPTYTADVKLSKGNIVEGDGFTGSETATAGYTLVGKNDNGDRSVAGLNWDSKSGGAQW